MGDATFKQQIGGYAQAGKLLKENNPDYQLIAGIAKMQKKSLVLWARSMEEVSSHMSRSSSGKW